MSNWDTYITFTFCVCFLLNMCGLHRIVQKQLPWIHKYDSVGDRSWVTLVDDAKTSPRTLCATFKISHFIKSYGIQGFYQAWIAITYWKFVVGRGWKVNKLYTYIPSHILRTLSTKALWIKVAWYNHLFCGQGELVHLKPPKSLLGPWGIVACMGVRTSCVLVLWAFVEF